MIHVTLKEMAATFTEWERRFREEPGSFQTEYEKAREEPETYGEKCASYFTSILSDVVGDGEHASIEPVGFRLYFRYPEHGCEWVFEEQVDSFSEADDYAKGAPEGCEVRVCPVIEVPS